MHYTLAFDACRIEFKVTLLMNETNLNLKCFILGVSVGRAPALWAVNWGSMPRHSLGHQYKLDIDVVCVALRLITGYITSALLWKCYMNVNVRFTFYNTVPWHMSNIYRSCLVYYYIIFIVFVFLSYLFIENFYSTSK